MNQNPENRNHPNPYHTSNRQNPENPRNPQTTRSDPRAVRNGQTQEGQPPRRILTEEERRRLEAARRAAAERRQSEGSGERPGPSGTRRPSAPPRNVQQGNAQGRQQRAAMVAGQNNPGVTRPVTQQSAAVRQRTRKKSRPNVGVILFLALCAVLIGLSIWQINRNAKRPQPEAPSVRDAAAEAAGEGQAASPSAEGTDSLLAPEGTGAEETPAENAEDRTTENSILTPELPAEEPEPLPDPPEPEPQLEPEPPAEDPNDVNLTLYDTVSVPNSRVDEGNLILVNGTHRYEKGDSVELKNAYSDRTGNLKVAGIDIGMVPEAFDALEKLAADFEADTGSHDLLLNSGHRTVAQQQEVWDYYLSTEGEDYARAYVAAPGTSEHNTGLACDLTFYTDDGQSIPVSSYDSGWWLSANCMNEGFIRRYPEDKADITGFSGEPWHFRYVGIPHALVCTVKNWCFEEYIEAVRAYSAEGILLYVTRDGTVSDVSASDGLPASGGWLIYFAEKQPGDSTSFKIPRDADYTVSGTNAGGYIVTVTLD